MGYPPAFLYSSRACGYRSTGCVFMVRGDPYFAGGHAIREWRHGITGLWKSAHLGMCCSGLVHVISRTRPDPGIRSSVRAGPGPTPRPFGYRLLR